VQPETSAIFGRAEHVRLIINADDLGISPVVNDEIFDHINRGFVSSATILGNGPAVADATHQIARFPQASFGVHLNATEFAPLMAHPGNPGFDEETRLLSTDWKSRLPFPTLIINYEQL
jgi:predicted glycoside hydrolase/deacetylase ChbG (UPF0249 family)